MAGPAFNIVLHQPQIPNNTGNIGRTCVATGCALHLIHPLGFDTSVKACRRAGLDYWPRLEPFDHESWESFLCFRHDAGATGADRGSGLWLFTTKAVRTLWDVDFRRGDWLVFGSETQGLPDEVLHSGAGTPVRFPMAPGERSLNVATAVCAAIYEGLRQIRDAPRYVRNRARLEMMDPRDHGAAGPAHREGDSEAPTPIV